MISNPFTHHEDTEPQAEELSTKGKPKRNLKAYLFVGIGALIVGFLLKDNFLGNEIVHKKEEVKPAASNQAKLSSELDDVERGRNKTAPPPLPAAPVAPSEKPEDLLAKARLDAAKAEALRQQSINGSSMSVSEVNIGEGLGNLGMGAAKSPEELLQTQMLKNSEKLLAGALNKDPQLPTETLSASAAFLEKHGKDSFEAPLTAQQASGKHGLTQGHMIRTVLLRAINSDVQGSILARVVSNVYDSVDGRTLVIPKGTLIYGEHSSDVGVGQTRLQVAADRMIYPNGKSVSLQKSTVSDMRGNAGLDAKVDNHFFQMFGTSLLVGAASWLMPLADQSTSVTNTASGTTTGGTIVGQSLAGVTKAIAERSRTIKPTLSVQQGDMFIITVGRDVILEEYKL